MNLRDSVPCNLQASCTLFPVCPGGVLEVKVKGSNGLSEGASGSHVIRFQ